jgi:hypothetical protein
MGYILDSSLISDTRGRNPPQQYYKIFFLKIEFYVHIYKRMLYTKKKSCLSYILYYMMLYSLLCVLFLLEVLNIYVRYCVFVYLNTHTNEYALFVANLILVHSVIKWFLALLKMHDYYLIYKKNHIKKY